MAFERITNSKTFVKYVRDEDLKVILDEYLAIKNLCKSVKFVSKNWLRRKLL